MSALESQEPFLDVSINIKNADLEAKINELEKEKVCSDIKVSNLSNIYSYHALLGNYYLSNAWHVIYLFDYNLIVLAYSTLVYHCTACRASCSDWFYEHGQSRLV